ncbi:MAG: hypothetical protein AAB519_03880 [Patescibacteria group bacterium]
MPRPGQPIDIKGVRRMQEYLAKGLTQAEVARVMKKKRQQITRWMKYINEGLVEPFDNTVDSGKE